MTKRSKAKPPTLGAIERGEVKLTKTQLKLRASTIGAFRFETRRFLFFLSAAHALVHATGATIDPEEDIGMLIERLRDAPGAAPVIEMIQHFQALDEALRKARSVPRMNAKKLRRPTSNQLDASPEAVKAWVAAYREKYGTERGSQSAASARFGLDPRTIAARLRT